MGLVTAAVKATVVEVVDDLEAARVVEVEDNLEVATMILAVVQCQKRPLIGGIGAAEALKIGNLSFISHISLT